MRVDQITNKALTAALVMVEDHRVVTTSLKVAEYFEKRHDHVLRDIRERILPYVSDEFAIPNFGESTYINLQGKEQIMYTLTRDGFTMVAMGYTGQKAMQFKEAYINAFNQMEEALRRQSQTPRADERLVDMTVNKTLSKLTPHIAATVSTAVKTSLPAPTQEPGPQVPSFPLLLTIPDAAQLLGVSVAYAYKLLEDADIPSMKVGRYARVKTLDLLKWLDQPDGTTTNPKVEPAKQSPAPDLSAYPDMLTVQDVQRHMRIGKRQAYELVHSEGFPAVRVGRSSIRIPKRDFKKWLDDQRKGGVS